jgi:hypothetical protein
MSITAMKQALEALEGLINRTSGQAIYSFMETERRIGISACVGLRQAIAEAEKQEPFGYLWPTGMHPEFRYFQKKRNDVDGMPVYTSPPQLQPLTDEQIYGMYNEPRSDAEMIEFARAIEAAHGIKGE